MMRGMGNMQGMMKQMQKMQKEMTAAQEKLNQTQFEGHDMTDMVSVTFTGDKKMVDMVIKPEAIDPDDIDLLQDLVIAAVNDAITKIETETQQTLGKYTKGMPGL